MNYYLPINKISVQVPREYYIQSKPITYARTNLVAFEGLGDFNEDEFSRCFVVKSRNRYYKRFHTYEEASEFYELVKKELHTIKERV